MDERDILNYFALLCFLLAVAITIYSGAMAVRAARSRRYATLSAFIVRTILGGFVTVGLSIIVRSAFLS